jgi:hypothetical protein
MIDNRPGGGGLLSPAELALPEVAVGEATAREANASELYELGRCSAVRLLTHKKSPSGGALEAGRGDERPPG